MPDLILLNATIYTQSGPPRNGAVAIEDGRIRAVGSSERIHRMGGGAPVIDLGGALLLPGFTDAHIHFHDLARRRSQVDLSSATSLEDALSRIAAHAARLPEDAWVLGYGWNESHWSPDHLNSDPLRAPSHPARITPFPDRHDLDPITGVRPAVLWRADLHAAWANTAALARAGIGPDSPNPPAGVIDRDPHGQATGILRELAIGLVRRVIPPPSEAEFHDNLLAVATDLHRLGIVAVHDQRMKDNAEEGRLALRRYSQLRADGRLSLRIACNIEAANLDHLIALGLSSGFGDEWLRLGHVKLFADGSLGARTAWMLEPYEGEATNTGMFLTSPGQITPETIQRAHRHGCAISIHAIGDRANREVLDIFAEVLAGGSLHPHPPCPTASNTSRPSNPPTCPAWSRIDLVASVQPILHRHCRRRRPFLGRARGQHLRLPLLAGGRDHPGLRLGCTGRQPQPVVGHPPPSPGNGTTAHRQAAGIRPNV
ncbi:MAG: amidohydrolase family protein [Caldilineales bacterium]|nr:amidohydrolase family protein [Caldilineales bacterium]